VQYGIVDESAIDDMQMTDSEMVTIAEQDKEIASLVPPGAIVALMATGGLRFWTCAYMGIIH